MSTEPASPEPPAAAPPPGRLVSVVVPARDEDGCLEALYQAVRAAFAGSPHDFELVVVNDGSTDGTADVLDRLAAADERVVGLHLARNFGHQPALLAGMREARGDAVVTIDADLEQPPAVILELVAAWERGAQIVHGVRRDHPRTGLFKRTTSRWFYRAFSFLSRVPMEPGMLDFRLMDRQVVDAIVALPESDIFLRGIAAWIGFRQARVPYQAGRRVAGRTKYGLSSMLALALRGITSFSTFPLRLSTYLGLLMTVLSLGYGLNVFVRHFFWAHPQPGYASTVLLISFLMGVQFLLIGLLGEYVGRIHVEVKRRPRYLVARRSGRSEATRQPQDRAAPLRRVS